jgi:alpha-beta hydrolase superfamily lysophospholipase
MVRTATDVPPHVPHLPRTLTPMESTAVKVLLTEDGLTLPVRWWYAGAPKATVVLVHGFTASKDHPDVVAVAAHLQSTGFDVISYDARGHGASEGESTLGDLERHDVAAAVTHALSRGRPVVLLGASMGAVAVLRSAAETKGYAGVVTVSSPAKWEVPRTLRSLLAIGLTQTGLGRRLTARRLGARVASRWTWAAPPVSLIDKIDAPVAIIHGARDRFILPRAATELYSRASEPRRLEVVPGMGHAFDAVGTRAIENAICWVLSRAAETAPTDVSASGKPATASAPTPIDELI